MTIIIKFIIIINFMVNFIINIIKKLHYLKGYFAKVIKYFMLTKAILILHLINHLTNLLIYFKLY